MLSTKIPHHSRLIKQLCWHSGKQNYQQTNRRKRITLLTELIRYVFKHKGTCRHFTFAVMFRQPSYRRQGSHPWCVAVYRKSSNTSPWCVLKQIGWPGPAACIEGPAFLGTGPYRPIVAICVKCDVHTSPYHSVIMVLCIHIAKRCHKLLPHAGHRCMYIGVTSFGPGSPGSEHHGHQRCYIRLILLPRCMECRRGLAMRIPSIRPSVRLSVRPSDAWIVTKRQKDMFRFLYDTKDNLS